MSDTETKIREFREQMEKGFPNLPKLPDQGYEDIMREADEIIRDIEEFIKRLRSKAI